MTFINIFSLFSEEIRLDVSSESSARQRIHMKNQALFSAKDKRKKLKCRLLQFLFGALTVITGSLYPDIVEGDFVNGFHQSVCLSVCSPPSVFS